MAGLFGGMFGGNPAYNWFDQNRNAIGGAFQGLIGATDFSQGAKGVSQGAMQGQQFDIAAQDKAKQQEQRQQVAQMFRTQYNRPDLASAVEQGYDLNQAWNNILTQQATPEPTKLMEINGRLVDPYTGELRQDYSDQGAEQRAAPAGYAWGESGGLSFIPGGPADPSTQAKTTEAQRRNQQLASVIQRELPTVDANWNELANPQNQAGGMIPGLGNMIRSPGYQQATNAISTIAQSYLYSVSGAAAPAEEVQKLVQSVTPTPFESPQSVAQKKLRIQQMADAVIQAGGGGQATPATSPGSNMTSTGVSWSVGQ